MLFGTYFFWNLKVSLMHQLLLYCLSTTDTLSSWIQGCSVECMTHLNGCQVDSEGMVTCIESRIFESTKKMYNAFVVAILFVCLQVTWVLKTVLIVLTFVFFSFLLCVEKSERQLWLLRHMMILSEIYVTARIISICEHVHKLTHDCSGCRAPRTPAQSSRPGGHMFKAFLCNLFGIFKDPQPNPLAFKSLVPFER